MFAATGMIKPLVAMYAALFCLILRSSIAQEDRNTILDCASSCGNIHIGYPFRLQTDPKHCGTKRYELACVADALNFYVSGGGRGQVVRYRVQAINYNNLTIRLADRNVFMEDCTLRVVSSLNTNDDSVELQRLVDQVLDGYKYEYGGVLYRYRYKYICQDLILASCPFPLTDKLEGFRSCNTVAVKNSNYVSYAKRYWYVYVGAMNSSDLEKSCRIEYKSWTSLLPQGANNITYEDVKNSLVYGFELSWESACSASEAHRKINCSREQYYFGSKQYNLAEELFWNTVYDLKSVSTLYLMYKGLLCFCGTPCVTIFLMYKWRRRHLSAYNNIEKFLHCNQNDLMPVRYSYSQIKKMTKGFKEKLGEGGYGFVYKGELRSGRIVAIKMLDKSKADGEDFINEVATIGRIHHVNVVQLIGYCVEGSKRALVYEIMDNGSLDKHIFSKEGGLPMNNKMIFDISLGVAHGIEYLHQGCDMQILHFDIKPHNILLDGKFIPKISDFGLAKLHTTDRSIVSLTAARGTIGYIAPEFFYKNIGGISYKADVYSFGMLLMEMVGRRKNVNARTEHSSRIYFPSWIYDQFSEGKEIKLEDETEEESNMVKKMIIVALWCIQLNPVNRPSMRKVIEMLEGEVERLKIPPKPFVAPQETPINDVGLNTDPEISSTDASSDDSDTISLVIK